MIVAPTPQWIAAGCLGNRPAQIRGARPAEWERIDLSRGVIRLERTKSGKRREVPMRQRVYEVLAARAGERKGRVWPVGDIRSAFETAVEAAQLDKEFTFHGCRHHFASWFVMRGGSLVALQQLLGHATLAMTMKYAHVGAGHLRDEVAKTERRSKEPASSSRESPSSKVDCLGSPCRTGAGGGT